MKIRNYFDVNCPKIVYFTLFSCLTFFTASLSGQTNPPSGITYQGFLTDAAGEVLGKANAANYDVVFRVHDTESGGTVANLKWSEMQTVVVDQGNFSVQLGQGTPYQDEPHPNLSEIFIGENNPERYLGMTLTTAEGAIEILPRLRFLTTPYSFLSSHSNTAGSIKGENGGDLLVTSGENIGIGEATPEHTLDVSGDIRASSGLLTQGELSVQSVSADGLTATPVLQTASGNVGIGVSVPTVTLDVGGDLRTNGEVVIQNGSISVKPPSGESGVLIETPEGVAVSADLQMGIDDTHAYLQPSDNRDLWLGHQGGEVIVPGQLKTSGTLTHSGVNLRQGTAIDTVKIITKQLSVNSNWQTAFIGNSMPDGTYLMELTFHNGNSGGHHWNARYSGIVAWRSGAVNDSSAHDIPLSAAAHAFNGDRIYLRINLRPNAVPPQLQIRSNKSSSSTTYTFKFRRML
ncbi:MAG: hypothetical protein HN758_04465 [Verrucomicrobia bacterium]|mgnify:CR=1 FL=1|jgi:hypothetical protein|nr:hypothetical protein [Verrucomicrobiota bacterium]